MAENWDDVAAQLEQRRRQNQEAISAGRALPAPAGPAAPDWDAIAGGIVQRGEAQRAADVNLLRFRDEHFPVEPARAADALRIGAATGQDPEFILKNLDTIGPKLKPFLAAEVDWDKVARDHPAVFGAVLDPVKGPVIRDAVADLTGLSWALTGKWEKRAEPVTVEDQWAAEEALQPRPELGSMKLVSHQVVPSVLQRALQRGVAQQEYVKLTYDAVRGAASPDYEQRAADLEEVAQSDLGAHGTLERAVVAPAEMLPYLGGRIAASAAGRATVAGVGAVVGGAIGAAATGGPGVVPGAGAGAAWATGVLGPVADYSAGVAWDTYQTVGPLYRQLTQLRGEDDQPLLTDEEARNWALGGSFATSAITAGLGGKLIESIPGVKQALGRTAQTALGRALAQRTVPAAIRDLAKTGGTHLATGALMLAAQQAGTVATMEAAASSSSSHEFDLGRVARGAADGFESGVRDLWLLSFWGPGRKFISDVGLAVESRRGVDRVARLVDSLEAVQKKVPAEGQAVADDVVSRLAQDKGPTALRSLYFRKEVWDARWQKLGLDPAAAAAELLGDGGKAYGEVTLHGGDLVVPVGAARRLLRSSQDAVDFVKLDARVGAELRSGRELLADQQAQLEQMRAAAATPDHVKQREAIFEAVRGRALGAGEKLQRATDLARQFADSAATVASRLGVPVAEAASMMGIGRLRIVGGPAEKLSRLRQDAVDRALPEIFGMLGDGSRERVTAALGSIPADSPQGRAVLDLARTAYFDPVTDMPTKLAFDDLAREAAPDHVFVAADMSGVKAVNDTFGHAAGNEALRLFSAAFRRSVEEQGGKVGRTGGDEFSATGLTHEKALAAARRVDELLKAAPPLRTREALADLVPELRQAAEAFWPASGDFRVSARLGIGPTLKVADRAELLAREQQLAKHGDVRKGGKTTQGHGETFIHDAFDPASPLRAEAEQASVHRLARWQARNPHDQVLAEVEPGVVVSTPKSVLAHGRPGEHGSLEVALDDGTGKPLEAVLHLTDPNALTGSHEFAHWLVESLSRMATRGELERAGQPTGMPTLREDYDALLGWAGWNSHDARAAESRERVALAEKKGRSGAEGARLKELSAKEERVSYAWEQFLGEGRAPAAGLAGAFRRFSRWVGRIYGGIEGLERKYGERFGQQLGLTDEVRDVFRRLIASQEEIAKAKAAEEHLPFTPALERMTEQERTRYAALDAKDRAAAEAALLRALTLENRRDQREVVTKLKAAIRTRVDEELDQNPTYQAQRYLAEGTLRAGEPPPPHLAGPDGKALQLDRRELVKLYGADLVKQLPQAGLADRGGVAVEDLAAALGFPSGDAMVLALAAAEPRERVAQRATSKRILEQLAPVLLEDPVRLHQAALDASYTEASAEKVNLAARTLAREIDPNLPGRLPQLSPDLARDQGARIIGEKPVGEISPEYYREAARAAGRRAFKEASAAAEKSDPSKRAEALARAHDAWGAQILSQELFRAAKAVREKVDAIREQLERTTHEAWRAELGLASPAYRDIHDELLAAVGIGKPLDASQPRVSLDQMLAQATADAAVMDESWMPTVRELLRRPREFGQLTAYEVQDLKDAVTNIRKAANLKNEVKLLDKKMSRDDLLAEMAQAARKANPQRARGQRDAQLETGDVTTLAQGVRGVAAILLGPEAWAKYLDGDNRDGPFHRLLVDELRAARDREAAYAKAYGQVLEAAWNEMPEEIRRRRFETVDLRKELPLNEALADSAWVDDSAVQRTYLWMLFLNRGNRENLQRLVDGYGWTVDQVDAALEKHLTRAEARFLQKLGDSFEGMYPEIAALHERDTGLRPGKVAAEPFQLVLEGAPQDFAGFYFPAKYDPRPGMSQRGFVAQERAIGAILNPESLYPGTPKGHTKSRAVAVHDVINLNWSVVPAHVSSVVHDLAFREYVRKAAYVVTDDRFRTIVTSAIGKENFDQVKPWLQAVATSREVAVTSDIRAAFGLVMKGRSRAMVGALGHRLSTAIGDLTNPILASLSGKVRPDFMALATAQLTPGAPGWSERWQFVKDNGSEVRFRAERASAHLRQEMDVIGQGSKLLRNENTRWLGELVRGAQESSFVMLETTDRITSHQIWLGAFLQEKAAGEKAGRPDALERAKRYANDVVADVMPAEWVGQKAAILRRRDVFGSILMFYGWLNKVHQLKRVAAHRAVSVWRDPGATAAQKAGATAVLAGKLLGISIAVALGDFASGHGKLQDDEDWAAWWRRKLTAGQLVDLPAIGPWAEWGYAKYVEGKSGRFPVRTAPGLAFGENLIREVAKAADGGAELDERGWAALKAAGLVGNLPVAGVTTTGQYVTSGRLAEDAGAGRPLDVLSGILYGERNAQPETPLTAAQNLISGKR